MTRFGNCHYCGQRTGFYNEAIKGWDCGCTLQNEEPSAKQKIPEKYLKRVRSGRWEFIEKADLKGVWYKVGIRRKSTGEERWFF